jgi:osmoprotectant transport system permease protein
VQNTYALQFAETVPMDAALMYSAARQGQVDVIVAFSTDGRIAAYDLLVLDDPRGAFPPYDAIILLSGHASEDLELVAALKQLVGAISDEAMRNANKAVDVDKLSPEQSARELLKLARSQ